MKQLLGITLATILVAGLASAQVDRGTFTGIVTDVTGAVIPGVKVTITSTGTGIEYSTTTTSAGQYTVPAVPIGTYDLSFESPGFNRLVQRNVEVGVGEVRRVDVSLEVGAVTESIEVTAEVPRLQTDAPDVATSLQSSAMLDLPLAIGGGGRTMEDLVYKIVPGTSGGTYRSYIVGTQTWSKASLLEGSSVDTVKPGHFGEASVSMEAVQEFKIMTSAVSAEYGRSQGAVFNYVLKSGTNAIHGTGYGLLRNEALNANSFANKARGIKRPRDRKWDYAGSFGGPVYLPKLYNGKNKTFFYFTYERYHEDNLIYGSPNQTLPIPDFYDGNFSRLLGNKLKYTDALGNPVYKGAVYDPSTFYQLDSGDWVGQMFPSNTIPKSRFSQVAQKVNAIMQQYYLPTVTDSSGQIALVNNAYRPAQNCLKRDQWQVSIKADHNIGSYHKLSGSYALNHRPRQDRRSGIWDPREPDGGPLSSGQYQTLEAHFARVAYDWTISPTVMNHAQVFYNRNLNDMPNFHSATDGLAELGIKGPTMEGYPIMNWGGGPFVKLTNPGYGRHWFVSVDAGGIQDTLSFSSGRHFVKIGADWRRNINHYRGNTATQFNFNATSTAIPFEPYSGNYTGYSFASYLLGIVYSGNLQRHTPFGYIFDYASAFIQDDFKVSNKLTLELGLRWDYRAPIREKHDELASWDYDAIDPVSGLKGAYAFAGDCSGCIGSSYFSPKDWNNFAPRLGLAWRVLPKTTIRAAYAIFFQGPGDHGSSLGTKSRFAWTPTYAYGADPVNPWAGRHNIDDGIPMNEIYQAPEMNPSWHIKNSAGLFDANEGNMPYIQRWNFNIQREITPNFLLDIGYLGVKGTGLYGGALSRVNQLPASVLQQYGKALTNPVTNEAQAAANGVPYPFPGYRGTVAGALREYPQVRGTGTITNVGNHLGFSSTHSFQVVLDKRFSKGFNAYISYTWQKTLANKGAARDFDGAVDKNYPLDYYNLALEKTVMSYDVPHMFKVYGSYELPFGRGRTFLTGAPRPVNAILGGWSVSAVLNYMSGTPLTFTGASHPPGWNGATNRLNIAAGEIVNSGYSKGNFNFADVGASSNTYLNKDMFSDPDPYTLGTAAHYYTQARGFGTISEDIGLQKNFKYGEKYRFQIRAEFLNLFNRHYLGGIVGDFRSDLFGQVTNVSGNRSVQLGVRVDF